jgi:nitrite reductase (NADH) large subunit
MKYVIIGNGIAGIEAAETIRKLDRDCGITLIAGETFPPYCRAMIGLYLGGSISPKKMVIRGGDFYVSQRIEPVIGQWVQGINVEKKEVHTDKGETCYFDRLLIATGADPQGIDVDGVDLRNVFFMRSESDVREIVQSLPGAKRALVLGCGLVGLKAAHGLLCQGLEVTIVEKLGYPLPLIIDEKGGEMVSEELHRLGFNLKTGAQVVAFEGNGQVKEAHLDDGSKIACDIVVVAIGVRPSISFLSSENIQVNSGIIVNEYMETSAPDVYAAGDVAESMDVACKETRVNAIWPVAVEQGTVAGMNMTGRKVPYQGSLRRNVLRINDTDILTGGLVTPPADGEYSLHSMEDHRNNRYRKLVFQDDVLVGLVMVNAVEQGGVLLSLMQQRIPVNILKDKLLQPSFNYSQLISNK